MAVIIPISAMIPKAMIAMVIDDLSLLPRNYRLLALIMPERERERKRETACMSKGIRSSFDELAGK